ncbi:hypothetical protein CLV56_1946 [Mumia flava]|uniref:Uncharacterized protein n=1 Tax=Mumia flava TaxID=1348852 RepID=A0A0B2B6L2_9ACTN|nr:hypothetical protein [Mumia flava]PJJ57708.1 hypothetical protein CLV56_1946 [Mumia flava]
MEKHDERERDRPQGFLVVARTAPGPYPHPVEVAVYPDGRDSRIAFSIGPHAANVGGQVPLARVVDALQDDTDPAFTEEFDAADLHWLVPFLVRLRAGEDVTDEIIDAYEAKHGTRPEVLVWEPFGR